MSRQGQRNGDRSSWHGVLWLIGLGGSLALLSAAGAAPLPAGARGLSGTYRIVGNSQTISLGGFARGVGRGTLELDETRQHFSLSFTGTEMSLARQCPSGARAAAACDRTFMRTTAVNALAYAGSFEAQAGGALTFTATSGVPAPRTFRGWIDGKRSLAFVALEDAGGVNLLFGLKEGASRPRLASRYAYSERIGDYPRQISAVGGAWGSFASSVREGDARVATTGFTAREQGSVMTARSTCAEAPGGCSASSTLASNAVGPTDRAGRVVRGDRGAVTFEVRGPDPAAPGRPLWSGFATPDGELLALLEDGSADGHQGLNMLTRVGSGLSNASVVGTYNAVALEEFMGTEGGVRNAFVFGPLTFDGTSWQFAGTDSAIKRVECQGAGGCPEAGLFSRTVSGGAGGAYTVGADGQAMLSGLAGDNTPRVFVGSVSSDASLVVLRRVGDDSPCSFDCSGQESFRSLIVAARQ